MPALSTSQTASEVLAMRMPLSRRRALAMAGIAAASALGAARAHGAELQVEAVGFDAFTIFDPRSIIAVVEEAVPARAPS